MESPQNKSWSIYGRKEITQKYEIENRIGSGAYADIYKAIRRSDNYPFALKEIHDYQSSLREIEALQTLQNCPNIVTLYEYFWKDDEDEDCVLVLEYLSTDLVSVIYEAKKNWVGGVSVGEVKNWMVQILHGVDACHRNNIVHRDLKPSNLLVSDLGVLKIADFGQARILLDPGFDASVDDLQNTSAHNQSSTSLQPALTPTTDNMNKQSCPNQDQGIVNKEKFLRDVVEQKANFAAGDDCDKELNVPDEDNSCLATCTTSEIASYTYESEDDTDENHGSLTSCVGTRWFRAPELLYGSTNYGTEIDLWSLGCIFAELFSLEPLFPGTSDIDQLGRIFNVLGNLTEKTFSGCSKLPDYNIISFAEIEKPLGLESCLPNRSPDEIHILKKLLCFDPANRATAMELLHDKYLNEEPLPVPTSELRVPLTKCEPEEGSPVDWNYYKENDSDSDSDFGEFGGVNTSKTDSGFSIRFD